MNCIFCDYKKEDFISENTYAFAIYDKFPVNKGHALIIPKRHFSDFFEATHEEVAAMYALMSDVKEIIQDELSPDGYNVGINIGEAGGQTIMHLHMHLIPRYEGDVENPRGGVRKLKKELVPYDG